MKNFFAGLFGKKEPQTAAPGGDAVGQLRCYLDANLPKSYVTSKKYSVSITEQSGTYAVRITLDMLADGSDYSNFGPEDYFTFPELEGGYVLGLISKPPLPISSYTLEMLFHSDTVVVEAGAGLDAGTITYRGESRKVTF